VYDPGLFAQVLLAPHGELPHSSMSLHAVPLPE
jgi:hypothetical protein